MNTLMWFLGFGCGTAFGICVAVAFYTRDAS